jgi:uncharacterized YigZ family protein
MLYKVAWRGKNLLYSTYAALSPIKRVPCGVQAFSYRTIQRPTQGLYKEKGSKFLAFAYPVSSEAAIKEHLDALRKEYFDARHHCYAWMLGPDKQRFRAADDGEPNHSAGDPILGQIRSRDLTDVLVVVVRYFGGIKLGVGGLISAYKLAAEDALQQAIVDTRVVRKEVTLQYDYSATPEVMRVVKEFDLEITAQEYTDGCVLQATVALETHPALVEKVALLRALSVRVALLPEEPASA